jgi:hypothetical protein
MTETPPEPVPNSILGTTKKALGLAEDYTPFDPELIMHINSVLADLNQLGIGPGLGFMIEDGTATWDQFLGPTVPPATVVDPPVPPVADPRFNSVKSYMFLKVRMLFDPPGVGYVLTAMEKLIEQAEWRINVAREDIVNPAPPKVVPIPYDPFAE